MLDGRRGNYFSFYISTRGIEDFTNEEIVPYVQLTGLIEGCTRPDLISSAKFVDSNGEEFFSINVTVGLEGDDETYISDSVPIFSYDELNVLNE